MPRFISAPRLTPLAASLIGSLAAMGAQAADKELGEVRVEAQQQTGIKPKLRDEIITTESIDQSTIEKTGATNVNEAVDKNPGIAVQTECSICNVRNVVLNNLPGRYTTLLIDGIPIYSSVSSAYGLDSIGVNGIERIDISRGAATSLIAPEALAGVVNLVTKRPTRNYNDFSLTVGSYGSQREDAFLARPFQGGAWTLSFNHNQHDSVDSDGNGISEYTGYNRTIASLGYFFDDVGGFKVKGRFDLVTEKRGGGALGDDYDAIKSSTTGNPFDWSKGGNGSPNPGGWFDNTGTFYPYNGGRGGMSEIIFTDRWQATVSGERALGVGKLRLAGAYAHHKQDSFYETDLYKANQDQYYLEASYQRPFGDTLVTAGVTYRYEDLKSTGMGNGGTTPNDGIDNYVYRTPALFLQAYRAFLDGKLEANGSVRFDKHNVFGTITSPRLNLLYHHNDSLSSRVAVGKGFRAPTSFFEQDHGVLNTLAIVKQIDKPEISTNASYALNYAADRLAWVASLNWNRIDHMAMLDAGQCRPAGGGAIYAGPCNPGDDSITLFTSAQRPVYVAGADATVTYKWTGNLSTTVGAERFNYRFDPGTLAFARPETRVYLAADYDSGPWDFYAKATWTGPQNLRRFYDYDNNPRYNFDGTPKKDWSPSYWTVDARAEYKLNKTTSLALGADNLFDYKQSDHESFLWVNSRGAQDVTQLWGPSRGRYIYGSLKLSF